MTYLDDGRTKRQPNDQMMKREKCALTQRPILPAGPPTSLLLSVKRNREHVRVQHKHIYPCGRSAVD